MNPKIVFQRITNKLKLILLAIGSLLLVLVMYRMAFSKTIRLRSDCIHVEQNLESSNLLPMQIEAIQMELHGLERIIGNNSNDENFLRQQLLEKVGNYCQDHSVKLIEIPDINSQFVNGYNIQNNVVRIQGSFKAMLGVVHKLEQEWKLARVMSVRFYLKRDVRKRIEYLTADIYLQNINE